MTSTESKALYTKWADRAHASAASARENIKQYKARLKTATENNSYDLIKLCEEEIRYNTNRYNREHRRAVKWEKRARYGY